MVSILLTIDKYAQLIKDVKIFVEYEYFQTSSEMISTGGNYFLFASSNNIQLLNININIILTVDQYSTLTIEPYFSG